MRSRLLLPGVVVIATLAGCAENRLTDPDTENAQPQALVTAAAGRLILAGTTAEIQNALQAALPGDTIEVAPGAYTGSTSTSGSSKAFFFTGRSGTASDRITLRGAGGPVPSVLQGTTNTSGYVFYVTPGPVPLMNTAYWGPPVRLGVDPLRRMDVLHQLLVVLVVRQHSHRLVRHGHSPIARRTSWP